MLSKALTLAHIPLACPEVSRRAATEVAAVRVGAAVVAGVLAGGALVDIGAAPAVLLVVEAGGARTAEAPQCVVARRPPTDLAVLTFILIWVTGNKQEVRQKVILLKEHETILGSLE